MGHVGIASLLTSVQFIATTHNTQWLWRVVKDTQNKKTRIFIEKYYYISNYKILHENLIRNTLELEDLP